MLEAADYHVTIATNGRQGLEIALQERPELIISDFMMPVLSGLQMVEQLRAMGFTAPIILCSAVSEDSLPPNDSLYDAFLLKPYRADQLIRLIDHVRVKRS